MAIPSKKSFNCVGHNKGKYKNFKSELTKVRAYLIKADAAATMVSVSLNIYRPNFSRYKPELQKIGFLQVTHKGICKEAVYKSDYLSRNPEKLKGGATI